MLVPRPTATTRSGSSAHRGDAAKTSTSVAARVASAAPTTRSWTTTAAARRSSRSSPPDIHSPTRPLLLQPSARRSSSSDLRRRWRRTLRVDPTSPFGPPVGGARAPDQERELLRVVAQGMTPRRSARSPSGSRRRGGAADLRLRRGARQADRARSKEEAEDYRYFRTDLVGRAAGELVGGAAERRPPGAHPARARLPGRAFLHRRAPALQAAVEMRRGRSERDRESARRRRCDPAAVSPRELARLVGCERIRAPFDRRS